MTFLNLFTPIRKSVISTLTLVTLLALFTSTVQADWTTYQHDAAHTGRSDASFDANNLKSASSLDGFGTLPAIHGRTLYATTSNSIVSFNVDTGQDLWRKSFDTQLVVTPPSYADGMIVYATTDLTDSYTTLNVRDAIDGGLLYTYPLHYQGFNVLTPTLYHDPTTNALVAYLGGEGVSAIAITHTGASTIWDQVGAGGDSTPTVASNSVIVAAPGQFYALDRQNGAVNKFHSGGVSGGGGDTVAYDEQRHEIYVSGVYDLDQFGVYSAISAYKYNSNSDIQLLWSMKSQFGGGDVAIGPDGNVFLSQYYAIYEYNHETGQIVRSFDIPNPDQFTNHFAPWVTPIISSKYVWAFTGYETLAFDLSTGKLVREFDNATGVSDYPYSSAAAIGDNFIVLREPDSFPSYAYHLRVFLVPEPSTSTSQVCVVAFGIAGRILKKR